MHRGDHLFLWFFANQIERDKNGGEIFVGIGVDGGFQDLSCWIAVERYSTAKNIQNIFAFKCYIMLYEKI